MATTEPVKLVKSAIRTMQVFSVFAQLKKPLSLAELSKQLNAPKSSCHELMQTLVHLGFILVIDGGKAYYPSRRFWDTAEQINQFNPIKDRIQGLLKDLRDKTGETVFIGRLQGNKVVYSEVFDGTHTIRYTAQSGDIKSVHASALGKALLSILPEEERERVLAGIKLARFNANTIASKSKLKQHLLDSSREGFFITRGEHQPDVVGLAIPITVQGHQLAIGMAGPAQRMEQKLKSYLAAMQSVAENIAGS